MVPHPIFVMNAETSRYYIDNLYTEDNVKCYQALNFIKNSIMGSNRQKGIVIANGILPKLLQVIICCCAVIRVRPCRFHKTHIICVHDHYINNIVNG